MKKILTLLFLVCMVQHAISQTKISDKFLSNLADNNKEIWDESDPYFTNTATAEFKNSSAVILAQRTEFVFDRRPIGLNKGLFAYEKTRRKIKLLDKSSVKFFSEMYFKVSYNDGKYGINHIMSGFGIRVFKSNGKKTDIPLEEAIKVAGVQDVPDYFISTLYRINSIGNVHSAQYFKIAVPDLQVGDIVEYSYIDFMGVALMGTKQSEFLPVYYFCNREYPVVQQKIIIKADEDFYINGKSINGAPDFVEKGDKPQVYEWQDLNRGLAPDKSWVNDVYSLPLVKFQVAYSSSEKAKTLLIGSKGEVNESVTGQQIADVVRAVNKGMKEKGSFLGYQRATGGDDDKSTEVAKTVELELKETKADKLNDDDYVKAAYYAYRKWYPLDNEPLDSRFFANAMMRVCKKRNIPCELVVTPSNDLSTMKDLLFKIELEWLVKIKDKYMYNPDKNSVPFESKIICEGNTAFLIPSDNNAPPQKVILPVTAPDVNSTQVTINCSVDATRDNMIIERNVAIKGIPREEYSDEILANTSALRDDYKIYNGANPETEGLKKKELEKYEKGLSARTEEEKKKKTEQMKGLLEENTPGQVVSYDDFVLVTDGRSLSNPVLSYKENYKLTGLTATAGKNSLLGIPQLIGKQTQASNEARFSDYDLDIHYTRGTTWTINFTIPGGYSLDGVNTLNTKVENETGAFITSAKVEGNQLTITARKIYKLKSIKKADWSKMLEILDAAYNFSQKKIVLRK